MTTATLIYDGECQFCRRGMQWFAAHDTGKRLQFLARNSDEQRAQFPHINEARYAGALQLIDAHGVTHSGNHAIAAALRTLPQWYYQASGWLLQTPIIRPFASIGYRLVAKYRRRIKCDTGSCQL